ncbi:MAG: Cysteine desulfurase [Syntrophorhabdus sp. PtaU1.Bin153]|nr:MAG: Cysteine desulfurase [Syntrophorhabdus sp. PtaU1.Bin153]
MIYWDYNATTPCAPEVVAAMECFWSEEFANPSSPHLAGKKAARAVATARSHVASFIECDPGEVVFTSGATESNNLIFLGLMLSDERLRRTVVITPVEHKSVLEPAAFLSERGFNVVHLPVRKDGVVDIDAARQLISEDTLLVSVQAANNEIGTLQPIEELSRIAHRVGALFHTDAAQALGKISVDVGAWGCDFASFSSHKVYGPKGVGALFVRGGPLKWPWPYPLRGGGQEGGLRPGTANVPAIVGFGEACRLAASELPKETSRLLGLRSMLEKAFLARFPNCIIHARHAPRLPGTISLAIRGISGDMLIANCQEHCISRGSACNSGSIGNSHVLEQITSDQEVLESTIRITLGKRSGITEVNMLVDCIENVVERSSFAQ